MKKVLILTASHGHGHLATARAVKQAIDQQYPDQIEVEIVDLLDELRRHWNQFINKSYDRTTKYAPVLYKLIFEATDSRRIAEAFGKFMYIFNEKRLAKFLTDHEPSLILINYAAYQEAIGLVAEKYLPSIPLISMITDSISVHSGWTSQYMDFYIVANQDTATVVKSLGASDSQIKTLGYPVNLAFSEPLNKKAFINHIGLDAASKTLLFLPTADKITKSRQIIKALLKLSDTNLVVITGRDQDLHDKLAAFNKFSNFHLVGWTDEMASFIRASDLVISKAGGSTVMECIAACVPMVIHNIIPGQEEGNAEYVSRHHLGIVELMASQIAPAINNIFSHYDYYKKNLHQHSNPQAAIKIADYIANLL